MAWHACSAVVAHRCRMTATSLKRIRATEAANRGQVEAKTRCRQGWVDLSSPRSRDHRTRVVARREASRGIDRERLGASRQWECMATIPRWRRPISALQRPQADCGAASGFENSGLPYLKMLRPDLGGDPAAREPGLGTGRGGDVTGSANSFSSQRAETVAGDLRGSSSETQTFGSDCDWRFTKR